MSTERFKAWQCIGCGRIDGPAQCVGVCQDRPVELVNADEVLRAWQAVEALVGVVRTIAHTRPKDGECLATWLALQARARSALAAADAGA